MPPQHLKLAVLTGRVPHYRTAFFDALASKVSALTVVTAGRKDESFLEGTGSGFRVIPLDSARTRWRSDVVRVVSGLAPDLLICEHGAALDYVWTVLVSPTLKCVPKILWTHGIISRDLYARRKGLGYIARMQQLRLADGVVCYDSTTADILGTHLPAKVIGSAPNSNDGSIIAATRRRLMREGRSQVRAKLGLVRRYYLLFLGRLVSEKEVQRAIPVLQALKKGGFDVGLVVVGHGPEEPFLRQAARAAGLSEGSDVIFAGPISDQERLAHWLFASDVCLSPGALGLSVCDCLYGGLPVISLLPGPKGPWHGPEWRYLEQGKTGFFAAEDSNDSLITECASYFHRSEAERVSISEACSAVAARQLGIEPMVNGMLNTVTAVIARRGRAAIGT